MLELPLFWASHTKANSQNVQSMSLTNPLLLKISRQSSFNVGPPLLAKSPPFGISPLSNFKLSAIPFHSHLPSWKMLLELKMPWYTTLESLNTTLQDNLIPTYGICIGTSNPGPWWPSLQRQTGLSVSYRKYRYRGCWYQYRSRSRHFFSLGISPGIDPEPWAFFGRFWQNSY